LVKQVIFEYPIPIRSWIWAVRQPSTSEKVVIGVEGEIDVAGPDVVPHEAIVGGAQPEVNTIKKGVSWAKCG
jgi:hypothetical protein